MRRLAIAAVLVVALEAGLGVAHTCPWPSPPYTVTGAPQTGNEANAYTWTLAVSNQPCSGPCCTFTINRIQIATNAACDSATAKAQIVLADGTVFWTGGFAPRGDNHVNKYLVGMNLPYDKVRGAKLVLQLTGPASCVTPETLCSTPRYWQDSVCQIAFWDKYWNCSACSQYNPAQPKTPPSPYVPESPNPPHAPPPPHGFPIAHKCISTPGTTPFSFEHDGTVSDYSTKIAGKTVKAYTFKFDIGSGSKAQDAIKVEFRFLPFAKPFILGTLVNGVKYSPSWSKIFPAGSYGNDVATQWFKVTFKTPLTTPTAKTLTLLIDESADLSKLVPKHGDGHDVLYGILSSAAKGKTPYCPSGFIHLG